MSAPDLTAPTGGLAEAAGPLCAAYGLACGRVFQFDQTPADNELGVLEMCCTEDNVGNAERRYGDARLSTHPRFDDGNVCLWQCPSARGCNALSGCWCEDQ